jgi:hypothetical protein
MANSKVHRQVGKVGGVVAAVARAHNGDSALDVLTPGPRGYAGRIGAWLPDIIEPAVHLHHRHVAYSVATATAISASAIESIEWVENYARMRAQAAAERCAQQGCHRVAEARQPLEEFLWKLSHGFVAGVGAGYLSHLTLDAETPRGIPLLMRGF